MRVILDATAITCWLRCREEFRQTYLCERASSSVAIHRELGIAVHEAIEMLWLGQTFETALAAMMKYLSSIDENRILAADKRKWEELKAMAPTMLATYSDSIDTNIDRVAVVQDKPLLEYEWQMPFLTGYDPFDLSKPPIQELVLVGRIDRVEKGPILVDVKTSTEMDGADEYGKKVGWEKSYRASMVKDIGLGLYDWYLRQIGLQPAMVALEVILKPSERYGKKCRVVRLELPEVLAYRERFDLLLEHTCKEILHYCRSYSEMAPWPMNVSACSGKYGNCHLLACCNLGINPRTERLYMPKVEHLSIEGKRIQL